MGISSPTAANAIGKILQNVPVEGLVLVNIIAV